MQPRDRLTAKEVQVATLVWEGLTNREIADVIGTTEQVVKNYLRNTFDKIGVWSRLELALYIAAHGGPNWTEEIGLTQAAVSLADKRCTVFGLHRRVIHRHCCELHHRRPGCSHVKNCNSWPIEFVLTDLATEVAPFS